MAKRRKAAKNAGKKPAKKSATSRKKRMGKPARKAARPANAHKAKSHARPRKAASKSARMTARMTARMAVRNPQHVMAMLPPAFAAMVRGRNRESVISILVVLFMVFATLSAGYFYPQPKAAAVATPAIMQVK
jgi:hypothetical protein